MADLVNAALAVVQLGEIALKVGKLFYKGGKLVFRAVDAQYTDYKYESRATKLLEAAKDGIAGVGCAVHQRQPLQQVAMYVALSFTCIIQRAQSCWD